MSSHPPLPPDTAYPLESIWGDVLSRIAAAEPPEPTGLTPATYLDLAERMIRSLAAWQDEHGLIRDPWAAEQYYVTNRDGRRVLVHTQARYLGALGQLLRAGRCADLLDRAIQAYEERLRHLDEVALSPEFYTKELVWAHLGLAPRVARARQRQWEAIWSAHDPWASYRCVSTGHVAGCNGAAFALAGEAALRWAGLGGDEALIEEAIAYLAGDFTAWGMYRDPRDPMTYDLVVKQQLDLARHLGYCGPATPWIDEICRRGAVTSLLMQSACGQMPFGGRSNQFHLMEAHFACLCETRAARCAAGGHALLASVYRRAGRRAVALCLPWIAHMEPFRHTKQGFHPKLGHGVDSGGPYSVYGALAASLLATAYHLADDEAAEAVTPAEVGGLAFGLWPAFHKVFASAGGHSVQVDTRADLEKDATGLGRLQRAGARPETALAGSIAAAATYDLGLPRARACLAIGPVWRDAGGAEHRLASLSAEIESVELEVQRRDSDDTRFEIRYSGGLSGLQAITETYRLSPAGLEYRVRGEPAAVELHILVPVIDTDGDVDSCCAATAAGLTASYRGDAYRVDPPAGTGWRRRDDPPAPNRNALYQTVEILGHVVRLSLVPGTACTGTDHLG